jgi:hypothetical protein
MSWPPRCFGSSPMQGGEYIHGAALSGAGARARNQSNLPRARCRGAAVRGRGWERFWREFCISNLRFPGFISRFCPRITRCKWERRDGRRNFSLRNLAVTLVAICMNPSSDSGALCVENGMQDSRPHMDANSAARADRGDLPSRGHYGITGWTRHPSGSHWRLEQSSS